MSDLRIAIAELRSTALAYRTRADRDAANGDPRRDASYNLCQAANFSRAADSIQVAIDLAARRDFDSAELAA